MAPVFEQLAKTHEDVKARAHTQPCVVLSCSALVRCLC
jgi:hypothetical protein